MSQIILISLGAGAASALLFAAVASGSLLAVGLFYLAPLPILLAGMAWSHIAGAAAAAIAAIALGVLLGSWFALSYLIGVGFPAAILAYLALLARPEPSAPGGLDWYPAGRLVLAAAIIAALTVTLIIPAFGLDFESYQTGLRSALERVLRVQFGIQAGAPLRMPNGGDPARLLDLLVTVLPPMAALLMMLTNLANLWFAARIARSSGRLKRPWPDIPAMTLPTATSIALATALALSFMSGMVALVAAVFSATLFMAYALVGLAVLHSITAGLAVRNFIIGAVWALVLVLGWPLALAAILGLVDSAIGLRGRIAGRRGPPSQPHLPGNPKE